MKKIKAPISIALFLIVIFQNSCAVINFGSRTEENPANAKLITSDIDHFYEAFDLAIQDTSKAGQIFKKFYFERGSKGLNDFFKTKIQSVEEFSEFVLAFKDYYQSIRNDVSNLKDLENEINLGFQKFEDLYPPAKFPDVYFLIGKYLVKWYDLRKRITNWDRNSCKNSSFRYCCLESGYS
ncbi:hypothetical protein LZ575_19695 [Antarcticibacterium sp. 1MA-6-2]|uniref:hypothetical protein n=1 Tax=Antarcticibacterium sp. 1MA-6-2 TaxID=2908210 RepID=UPI001F250C16|nr:hypothetical protein [Antarcticibacterium sp. 1MA-6-2]UJH90897.1 hypothetical protein LZ575_19695 [Antarcticibacterium sp. 1MA-6-2]